MSHHPHYDHERTIEFEFVRATENAALNCIPWLGRGQKELADQAACDAMQGVLGLVNMRAEVVIGEGIKDNAPGLFLGDRLGTWVEDAPRFDIAVDPIDGTTNMSKGLPNAISVISAAEISPDNGAHAMKHIPTFYAEKLAYGPMVVSAIEKGLVPEISFQQSTSEILDTVARALGKRVSEIVVTILDRPRHDQLISEVRQCGAALQLITDGDITAAVAPSLPESTVDLYMGSGGAPEGVLTAAALKALGGEILLRMWPRDEEERADVSRTTTPEELQRVFRADDLVEGNSAIFCATGISDSPLLPGVKLIRNKAITHSILMRAKSKTVRYIKAVHNLETKRIHLRSDDRDHNI